MNQDYTYTSKPTGTGYICSFSILKCSCVYTPGFRKMTLLHTPAHAHTHKEQKRVWRFGWMLLGSLTVSPTSISCKVHITDKLGSMTLVRYHGLRLLNWTYCSWHWDGIVHKAGIILRVLHKWLSLTFDGNYKPDNLLVLSRPAEEIAHMEDHMQGK